MTTLCKIENGIVVNRAHFDGAVPEGWLPEGETWVESDEAQIGWAYAEGAFTEPTPAPEPPEAARRITPYRIVRRLEEAGLLAAAQALLDANVAFKWRFTTAPDIAIDDADLVAGLQAIGADLDTVLAPG